MNRSKLSTVLSIIAVLIAGIILVAAPGSTLITAAKILGTALIVFGVIRVVFYFLQKDKDKRSLLSLLYGFVGIVAGILIFAAPTFLINLFPVIAGIIIAVSGLADLIRSLRIRKLGGSNWVLFFILSLLTIAFGALIMFNPFESMTTLIRVIGVILIYDGIVGLIAAILL